MFKPTKKQHVVNKAYADKNGGSGGEPLIVNVIDGGELSGDALDRTWQEIYDAFPNVILRRVHNSISGEKNLCSVINVRQGGLDAYSVDVFQDSQPVFTIYHAEDPNGYPKIDGEIK